MYLYLYIISHWRCCFSRTYLLSIDQSSYQNVHSLFTFISFLIYASLSGIDYTHCRIIRVPCVCNIWNRRKFCDPVIVRNGFSYLKTNSLSLEYRYYTMSILHVESKAILYVVDLLFGMCVECKLLLNQELLFFIWFCISRLWRKRIINER